jgi:hypothetical protein
MQPPKLSVEPLADNLIVPDDHCPHEGIWADLPPAALREFQSAPEVIAISGCQQGSHQTD